MRATRNNTNKFGAYVNKTLERTKSVEQLKVQIQSIVDDMGFAYFDYSHIAGDHDIDFLMTTIPETFLDTYRQEHLYEYDMMVEYVMTEAMPIFQSDVDQYVALASMQSKRLQKYKIIQNLAAANDIHDGFCTSLSIDNTDNKAVFSLIPKSKDVKNFRSMIEDCRFELHQLIKIVYSLAIEKFANDFLHSKQSNGLILTHREIQTLQLFGDGCNSAEEAAERLCISPSTLNKHLNNLRKKMGVTSTTAAVSIAIGEKLITPARFKPESLRIVSQNA